MNDPVPVSLKTRSGRAFAFGIDTAFGLVRTTGIGCERQGAVIIRNRRALIHKGNLPAKCTAAQKVFYNFRIHIDERKLRDLVFSY